MFIASKRCEYCLVYCYRVSQCITIMDIGYLALQCLSRCTHVSFRH